MAWYDEAVFYHIYPLGLTGAPKENSYGEPVHRLNTLLPWISHVKEIGCNAIYIGPLFESVGHGYETTDYKKLDSRLGTNEDLTNFVAECHEKGLKADVFPQNPTKENILKAAAYLIASPDVEVIFTSNPYVLARYGTNKKVHDARKYDNSSEAKKAGIEHVTHFDITLTKKFGGTEQIKPAVIKSSNPVIQKKR